jgi:hypothetical protein
MALRPRWLKRAMRNTLASMIPQAKLQPERAEEHGPHLDCVCGHDAEGQSEGKRHYQAEQDLGDPVYRFQDSIRRFGRKLRQWVDCHLDRSFFVFVRGRCGSPLLPSPPSRLSSVAALSRPSIFFEVPPKTMRSDRPGRRLI